MEEIVVALRETRRAAGRSRRSQSLAASATTNRLRIKPRMRRARPTLPNFATTKFNGCSTDNSRLNERVMYLLKVIEQEQPRDRADTAAEVSHDAILHDIRKALEDELRPVLDVLLRLLEKLHASPVRREPHNDGAIIDLDARAHE